MHAKTVILKKKWKYLKIILFLGKIVTDELQHYDLHRLFKKQDFGYNSTFLFIYLFVLCYVCIYVSTVCTSNLHIKSITLTRSE